MSSGGFSADSLASDLSPLVERCAFPPAGTPYVCAVSGGADSSALAVLAVAAGLVPTLVHVDHGLRPGSAAEAAIVQALAGRLGVPFSGHTVSVEPGPNLEERCRLARFAVLPEAVATGHTADDVAETIVANLLRGSGLAGLSPMMPSPRKPIVELRRDETVKVCRQLGLAVVQDPMNQDPAYTRVRIRHEVLPLLNQIAGRDVVPILSRQRQHLALDEALLGGLASELEVESAPAIGQAEVALARRALRTYIMDRCGFAHPPDLATVDRALDVARGVSRATDLGQGWRLRRSEQRLYVDPPKSGPTSHTR